jgi:phage anti-repressor protein
MRVMCIERSSYLTNSDSFSIEVGDWLEVYNPSTDYQWYTFEMNNQEWFIERNKFITVQQFRHKQLKKIGV